MEFKEVIQRRRAYRALDPVNITKEMINDLAEHAQLAASCYNKQPWHFVFVFDPANLRELHPVFPSGNAWAKSGSMIIAVVTKKDLDCVVKDREYYLFDTGMATAHLILRATDLGLVAHPIAGYDQDLTRDILNIPEEYTVITLLIIGKHSQNPESILDKKQLEREITRPPRKSLKEFVHLNRF